VSRGSQSATRDATYKNTFKVGLETYEITVEAIDHGSGILGSQGDVGHEASQAIHGRTEDGVSKREEGVVSTNVVRGRVRPYLVFEASGVDLTVFRGVAPTAETGRRVVPDGCVVKVTSVCPWIVEKVHDVDGKVTAPMVQSQYGWTPL